MRRADPVSGLMVEIAADGGSILLIDPDGATSCIVPAPHGFTLSHFVDRDGRLFVVGQGEAPVDGWPDWHFEIDAAGRRVVRSDPAY